MKKLNKIFFAAAVMTLGFLGLNSCAECGTEFEHDNNLFSDVRIKTNTSAQGVAGKIIEYNAAGEIVPADQVTIKSVAGGHGVVLFELPATLRGIYDPEHCYLGASLTFDEIVRPGLSGIKNITNRDANGVAQGIEVTITSGIGTVRPYTIIGYFEGEYQLTED